jgi:hypothetical protein
MRPTLPSAFRKLQADYAHVRAINSTAVSQVTINEEISERWTMMVEAQRGPIAKSCQAQYPGPAPDLQRTSNHTLQHIAQINHNIRNTNQPSPSGFQNFDRGLKHTRCSSPCCVKHVQHRSIPVIHNSSVAHQGTNAHAIICPWVLIVKRHTNTLSGTISVS